MDNARAADAAARVLAQAPELVDEPVALLVDEYLEAAEPHDFAMFDAADIAGAIVAVLRSGRTRRAQ